MELVREFPLVPLRHKSEFEEAIKVMKRLAYRRSSLSNGEADYLTVLGDLIAQYEKKLPRLAQEMTPREALQSIAGIVSAAGMNKICPSPAPIQTKPFKTFCPENLTF